MLKCGGGQFSDIAGMARLDAVLNEGEIAIIYGAQKYLKSGQVEGHYFLAVKVDKKLCFIDGQTGEFVRYANTTECVNFIKRGYLKFMYTKVGKIKK